jgi:hypothetical protein
VQNGYIAQKSGMCNRESKSSPTSVTHHPHFGFSEMGMIMHSYNYGLEISRSETTSFCATGNSAQKV